ncbi:MAG: hypothetical protein LBR82_08495 [Desulfovibrio sp.]|nr:hypothetical protein [Desulfovibrio sp.]
MFIPAVLPLPVGTCGSGVNPPCRLLQSLGRRPRLQAALQALIAEDTASGAS